MDEFARGGSMEAIEVDILVLNYNGRALLAECLPSIVAAAANSQHRCRLVVVDNGSTDDSRDLLRSEFPTAEIVAMPNLGLVSFNEAVVRCSGRVVLLLNNDIRLDGSAVDRLVEPFLESRALNSQAAEEPVFLTTPRCFLFDGVTHEGFKTAVCWRRGLVKATSHFAGAEDVAAVAGETASAGAAIAVDREAFLKLGGFDPLYLPGRIEDLDFCFRGFMAGYRAVYVPESVAWHRGAASFGAKYGEQGNLELAWRNTLLFQWKNLRLRRHRLRAALGVTARLAYDMLRSPALPRERRLAFIRAWREAKRVRRSEANHLGRSVNVTSDDAVREAEYFSRFSPRRLAGAPQRVAEPNRAAWLVGERGRDANYPLASRYLRPVAERLAFQLYATPVKPWHLTIVGLSLAVLAAIVLVRSGSPSLPAAGLILAAYLCDRIDGPLARLRKTATQWGAWLDANVDEAVDLGLHVCTAAVAARQVGDVWPWWLLAAFLMGKYLLMHGLHGEQSISHCMPSAASGGSSASSAWRSLYHWPANADVRMHLLIAAVASGLLVAELALVAVYYNLRWPVRYFLVARRLRRAAGLRGAA